MAACHSTAPGLRLSARAAPVPSGPTRTRYTGPMARSQVLLGVLLILLAIAGWLVLREPAPEFAPAGLGEPGNRTSKTEHVITAPTGVDSRIASAAPVPDPDSSPAVKDADAFLLRGKVLEARRFVAANVEVRLVRTDGSMQLARSDALGRFEFALLSRPGNTESVVVWALRGEETAVKSLSLPGSQRGKGLRFLGMEDGPLGDVDAGALTLEPGRALRVEAFEGGQPANGADVRVWLGVERVPFWRGTCDAQGSASTPALPAGLTKVEVARGTAQARARVYLPEESQVRLELAPCFEATVTLVDKSSAEPIAGAMVEWSEYVRAPSSEDDSKGMGFGEYVSTQPVKDGSKITDASGTARFPGLSPTGDYYVRISAVGFESYPPQGSSGSRISAARPLLRLELARAPVRSVRWPIAEGEAPVPPEGARIDLSLPPGSFPDPLTGTAATQLSGIVQAGEIVAEGVGERGLFLGTAPDGSMGQLYAKEGSEVGAPVSFRRPRSVEVLVRNADGTPVAGAGVQVRSQGNNPLGEIAATDADGLARVNGLYAELADVYVRGPGPMAREVQAGSVNLKASDGRVEFVLPSSTSMRAWLEVRIDGVAQLPSNYTLRSAAGVLVVEEKPQSGEILLALNSPEQGQEIPVSLTSKGFLPARIQIPIVRDAGEPRVVIQLVRGATLTALVTMPRGQERVQLKIQSWNEAAQSWGPVKPYFNALSTPNGPGGSFRFFQLLPGRYQVLEERSKTASDPVDIVEGQLEAQVELDLEGLEWVSGRVEVPDPAELERVRVLCSTATVGAKDLWLPGMKPPEGVYVGKDGSFRAQVKRGVTTHLRAWHPWLTPADPGGQLDVDAGREGVVLQLQAGDEVRMAAPQLAAIGHLRAARVALYEGGVQGEPRAWLHAPLVDGVLRFSGVPRGRATLWIDPGQEFAPLVLENVEIGAGITDLGAREFSRGSSLRLRLSVKQGEVAPRIYVHARRTQAPTLDRQLNSDGEAEVVLSGLEAGSYAVTHDAIMNATRRPAERQIEFDGVSDVVITIDPR